jgi:tetratricopeptide (TPR) repeat protein
MILLVAAMQSPALADAEFDALSADVQREPDNVDARLKLALYLSRTDENLDEAKKQADMVTAQAPTYWDAYLLLARIAGRKKQYDVALSYIQTVLKYDAKNAEALDLKIDILMWSENWQQAETELKERIRQDSKNPTLQVKQGRIDLAKKKSLSAYRHAKQALAIDPSFERARTIIQDSELVTVYANHEFEYFGFPSEESKKDRFGYGLSLAGRIFRGARVSAALLETSRYRFQTTNNQVGLELNAKPMHLLELTLRGLFGAPARVIPKGSLFFSVRSELWKRMDTSLGYALDILAWPANRPALLHRPSLALGVYIDPHFNLSAGYTMGLLEFCGRSPTMIHSANVGIGVRDERVGFQGFYSYGQEIDPYILGAVSISSCEMIDAATNSTQGGTAGFRLVDLRIHTGGMSLSWILTRRISFNGGYRFELRMPANSWQIIPAHITNIGLVMSF